VTQESDHYPLDHCGVGANVDRSKVRILGYQNRSVAAESQTLKRRFSVDCCNHYVAVIGGLLMTYDHMIAIENSRALHTLASHQDREMCSGANPVCGHSNTSFAALLSRSWHTRSDVAHNGDCHRRGPIALDPQ